MPFPAKALLSIAVLVLVVEPGLALADSYQVEVTPGISVSQTYNDNINLDKVNKKSDFIQTLSPSLNLNMSAENNTLQFGYLPAFVRYDKQDQNNTVRHSGSTRIGHDLGEHLRFELADTYTQTEEPIEETEGVETVRRGRRTYRRNNGQTSLSYRFGPENTLTAGYVESLLKNDDLTLGGGKTQNPFATLAYHLDAKNGMEARYRYTKADFTSGTTSLTQSDHTGHNVGMDYYHRFTPQGRGFVGFDFTNRLFENQSRDYRVYEGKVGFQEALSLDLSYSVGGGYFVREFLVGERSTSGLSYDGSLSKAFEKGRLTLGARKGWGESYLDVEREGFTSYWSVESRFDYPLSEWLGGYVRGSYRADKDDAGKEWESVLGSGGIRWQVLEKVSLYADVSRWTQSEWKMLRGGWGVRWDFLRWFYAALDYSRAERDDDLGRSDYKVNRVSLLFGATKPYKW